MRLLKKIIRIIILLFAYLFLIDGVIFGLIVLTGGFEGISIVIDMFLPQLAAMAFIYLIIMILVIRLKWGQKKWRIFTLVIGLMAFTLNFLPFTGINATIRSADSQFTTTFGENWNELIPADLALKFRAAPFSFWDCYNGIPLSRCNVSYDIEYTRRFGNDSLRFDVYSPLTGDGPFPAIINIHGGGWSSGNKGAYNLFQMSRYLASQGYVIFDIMYGLAETNLSALPELMGRESVHYNNSYTIPMMIENIGNFTHYLANHAMEYKVNLSSVYVLGRSAGAHLAGCVGLGYKNAPYSALFNQTITIRGCILYYPPINMTTMLQNSLAITRFYRKWIDIQGVFDYLMENNATKYNEYSSISYVDSTSPPVLILHGQKDRMVPITESRNLQAAMTAVGRTCILIEMPFMGHAFDMLAGNPYSQISYYYLERFLALTTIINV
jgi:acetyl esterase/lipase